MRGPNLPANLRIRLVIFDLDGTLADTGADLAGALNEFRHRRGLKPLPPARVIEAVGEGVRKLLKKTVPAAEAAQPGAADEFRRIYFARCLRKTRLYPGVRASLQALAKRGVILAVASNKPRRHSERILRGLGIRRLFRAVLCGDEVPRPKPHPDHLRILMRRFHAKPRQTLVVGDSRFDMEAGKRAGCLTAAVTYGFGSRREVSSRKPDFILNRLPDLLKKMWR